MLVAPCSVQSLAAIAHGLARRRRAAAARLVVRVIPELPEVETIRRQLGPRRGAEDNERRDSRTEANASEPPAPVACGPRDAVVERVLGSGKYLVWELSADRFLLIHWG
jgi:hypothetical protein